MADIQVPGDPPPILLPCITCTRTFRPEVLERHIKVCEKTLSKKRKVFDSFKSRVSGTDLAEFLGPLPLPGQKTKEKPREKTPVSTTKAPCWRKTHEALQATLKAARSGNGPSIPVVTLGEQCSYCGRSFGPHAYDRHVEFCREKSSRIQQSNKSTVAQQRLEARTKYRAPLTRGRSPLKDKYSPVPTRKDYDSILKSSNSSLNEISKPSPNLTRTSSLRMNYNLTRQSSGRNSFRQRSPEKSSYKKPMSAQQTPNVKTPLNEIRPKTAVKRSTDSSTNLSKSLVAENLASIRAAAERQMHLLMSWPSADDSSPQKSIPSIEPPKPTPNKTIIPASPTSAFASVSPSNKENIDDQWERIFENKFDINENEMTKNLDTNDTCISDGNNPGVMTSTPKTPESARRSLKYETFETPRKASDDSSKKTALPPPRAFDDSKRFSTSSQDDNRYSGVSLSSLSVCSDVTIADEELISRQLEVLGQGIKRSRKKTFARSKSLFDDRNAMLFAQTYDRPNSSSDDGDLDEVDVGIQNFPDPLIPIVHRSGTWRAPSPIEDGNTGDFAKKLKAKLSADSAYSSLNRRDGISHKCSDERLSSSDTDSPPRNMPSTQTLFNKETNNNINIKSGSKRVSKFCHECGSKYPVVEAKFCCECGIRRLLVV